jgi:hypothetical protein
MPQREVWQNVADQLDREAARIEEECALAGVVLPEPGSAHLAIEQVTRSQWRDAGVARSLRLAAAELRSAGRSSDRATRLVSTSQLRVDSWLLARQVEYDSAADAAMTDLARCDDARARPQVLARSAYTIGQARGIRLAADIWAAASRSESPAVHRR